MCPVLCVVLGSLSSRTCPWEGRAARGKWDVSKAH